MADIARLAKKQNSVICCIYAIGSKYKRSARLKVKINTMQILIIRKLELLYYIRQSSLQNKNYHQGQCVLFHNDQ